MIDGRVVLVVKYFPPYPRISGVLTSIALLCEELGRRTDLHVVTSQLPPGIDAEEVAEHCTVHRVGWPFPLTAARSVRSLAPRSTVCVSGIYQLERGAAYFAPTLQTARRSGRTLLYQATWPQRPPGPVFRKVAGRTDAVLGASSGLVERLQETGVQATVLEPAVDVERLAGVARRGRRAASPFRVGFVNHLNEVKGADLALGAIAELSRRHGTMEFVVAGEGSLRDELSARYADVPRMSFDGFLADEVRMEVLASCDVVLLPFRQAESVLGVSQTALEVMALGGVVVGSRTRSLTEAIGSGRSGVLLGLDELSAGSLADVVGRLSEDPDEMERLRRGAAAAMTDRWSVGRRADELLEVLAPNA